jgi:hypothetical protein
MDNYYIALQAIQDSLKKSIQPVIEYQEFINNNLHSILSAVSDQIEQTMASIYDLNRIMYSSLEPYVALQESIKEISTYMNDVVNSNKNLFAESMDFTNILNGITVQDDCIELNDSALYSANALLESKAATSTTTNNDVIDRKMSINAFIVNILYPLLLMLIPMMQTSYNRSVDSLQEQRNKLKEEVYQEKMLELTNQYNENFTQLNTNINELLDSLQESQWLNQEQTQELSGSYSSDDRISDPDSVESLSSDETVGESDSSDAPQQPD